MKTLIALVLAALWSVALIVAATVVPFYQSSSASSSVSWSSSESSSSNGTVEQQPIVTSSSATLVEVNGPRVLGVVAIPLLAVGAVSASLWHRRARGKRGPGPLAWTVVALCCFFTPLALLSIGIFLVPVTFLLVLACVFAIGAPGPDPSGYPVSSTGSAARPPGSGSTGGPAHPGTWSRSAP